MDKNRLLNELCIHKYGCYFNQLISFEKKSIILELALEKLLPEKNNKYK